MNAVQDNRPPLIEWCGEYPSPMAGDEFEALLVLDVDDLQSMLDGASDRFYAGLLDKFGRDALELAIQEGGIWLQSQAERTSDTEVISISDGSMLKFIFDEMAGRLDMDSYPGMPVHLVMMVGSLPSVNGAAFHLKRTGATAVVLNHGLSSYLSDTINTMMGLLLFADSPYCGHVDRLTSLISLGRLAEALSRNVPAMLVDLPSNRCWKQHPREHSDLHEYYCQLATRFLVAHELGHACLGHLDESRTRAWTSTAHTAAEVPEEYERSREMELEADRFALDLLRATTARAPKADLDLAFGIGCIFLLQHACEVLHGRPPDQHPGGHERWAALCSAFPTMENSSAEVLGGLFDFLTTSHRDEINRRRTP